MLAFFVLTACNSETHTDTKAAGVKNNIHQYKYPGKPQPPVDMKYKFTSAKSSGVGENIEIELTFTSKAMVEDLVVQLNTDSGLIMMNSSDQYSFGPQSKGDKSVLNLTVQPEAVGYYYIYISASLVDGGTRQSRSFNIPVNVGNVNAKQYMKPAGVVQEDSTGQKIISMPASPPKK